MPREKWSNFNSKLTFYFFLLISSRSLEIFTSKLRDGEGKNFPFKKYLFVEICQIREAVRRRHTPEGKTRRFGDLTSCNICASKLFSADIWISVLLLHQLQALDFCAHSLFYVFSCKSDDMFPCFWNRKFTFSRFPHPCNWQKYAKVTTVKWWGARKNHVGILFVLTPYIGPLYVEKQRARIPLWKAKMH